MAVKLRLVRLGRRHRPFYRLRVGDGRCATTGRFIEEVGFLDPVCKDESKQAVLKKDRIEHWLNLGVTTSPSVRSLLKKNGITCPQPRKKTRRKKKES